MLPYLQTARTPSTISNIEKVADVLIFHLHGDLGSYEIQYVAQVLKEFVKRNWHHIVLDFKEVQHVDYKNLIMLMTSKLAINEEEGVLKLSGMNHYIQKIFNFMGFFDCFEIYDSLAEAILSFDTNLHSMGRQCPN